MHFAKSSIARPGPLPTILFAVSDDLGVFCTNKLRLRPHPKLSLTCIRVVYDVSAFLERQSHARTLLEVIEGQQMVSGGDVNDTSIAENGE
jgi:hypothetical protein